MQGELSQISVMQPSQVKTSDIPYSSHFMLDQGKYVCLECSKSSGQALFTCTKRQAIVRHIKKKHLGFEYTCKECSRGFRNHEMLGIHQERMQHGAEPWAESYGCEYCDYESHSSILASMHAENCPLQHAAPVKRDMKQEALNVPSKMSNGLLPASTEAEPVIKSV